MIGDRQILSDTPLEAWFGAIELLLAAPGHTIQNLIVRISNPLSVDSQEVVRIDRALGATTGKSIRSVARTIMPESVFTAHDWIKATERILPRLRLDESYFRRMVQLSLGRRTVNQLSDIINAFNRRTSTGSRMVDPGPLLLELPSRTAPAHIGFPCLSSVQFHRWQGVIHSTAVYRSHWYHDKALGNFIGLGRLQGLVARETGLQVGELTVVSTQATMDKVGAMQSLIRKTYQHAA